MSARKKISIDGIDRDIIRVLDSAGVPLTSSEIARSVNMSPPAIMPRLINLKKKGIIKPVELGGMRTFERKFGNETKTIESRSSIAWELDVK